MPTPDQDLINELINARQIPEPMIPVLDDYQNIETPPFMRACHSCSNMLPPISI
jgi:hypothetical protein